MLVGVHRKQANDPFNKGLNLFVENLAEQVAAWLDKDFPKKPTPINVFTWLVQQAGSWVLPDLVKDFMNKNTEIGSYQLVLSRSNNWSVGQQSVTATALRFTYTVEATSSRGELPEPLPSNPSPSSNTCPVMPNAGWLTYPNTWYKPFIQWPAIAYDGYTGEFRVLYDNGQIVSYTRVNKYNSWVNLRNSGWKVCVDSGSAVYAAPQ
jgi:hypothetical protein